MAIPIKAILSVSSKGFNIGMKTATKAVGGLVAITKMAAFAIAGLTAAFTAIILRQTAYIDRIGKVSKVTGVAAETLQKFGFAAELAGVSVDQAQVALRRFSRRLGEAQRNTGELAPTLRRLGIDVRNADGSFRSAEEVLFDLSDAIANTENESEALSIAFKAFDSEGAELVNVLNQGSDAMRELFNRAELLGGVLSTNTIQQVENFNDRLNELQTLIGGITNAFVGALAPALNEVTEDLVDFLAKLASQQGGFENLGNFLKDTFLDIIQNIVVFFAQLANVIINVANEITDLARTFRLLEPPKLTPELQKQRDLLEEMKDLALTPLLNRTGIEESGIFDMMDEFGLDTKLLREELERIESSFGFFAKLNPFGEYNKQLVALQGQIANIVRSLEIFQEIEEGTKFELFDVQGIIDYLESLKAVPVEVEKTNEEVEDQLTLFEKIEKLIEGMPARMEAFRDATVDLETVLENVAQRLGSPMERLQKTLEDGLVKGVEIFEDTLTDAILQGKADFSALGDHIKAVLAKALVQRFITGPILAAFGLAEGGPAQAGRPYIVGEEGPELFVPNTSGTVIPNDQITGSGGMGVGGTVVNYNIQAVDAPSFQSLVARDPEFIYAVTRAGARRIPGGG